MTSEEIIHGLTTVSDFEHDVERVRVALKDLEDWIPRTDEHGALVLKHFISVALDALEKNTRFVREKLK